MSHHHHHHHHRFGPILFLFFFFFIWHYLQCKEESAFKLTFICFIHGRDILPRHANFDPSFPTDISSKGSVLALAF